MFKTRLLSGIVLVVVALLTIISGGVVLWATLLGVSLIGVQELYKATGVHKEGFNLLEIMGYVSVAGFYICILGGWSEYYVVALVLAIVLLMCVFVFGYPKYESQDVMYAFFGIVYVAVMLSFIYQTRCLEDGLFLVGLIFLSSWGCDTCAYCVGVLIGKHKMAPVLSPKKSIEGAIGGAVGAALLGVLYAWLTKGDMAIYAIICLVGAGISMVGDLAASGIKRQRDIKDYGRLIPGHGGILDRFDSVIFTAPIIFFLADLMM